MNFAFDKNLYDTFLDKKKLKVGSFVIFYCKNENEFSIHVVTKISDTVHCFNALTLKPTTFANTYEGYDKSGQFYYRILECL